MTSNNDGRFKLCIPGRKQQRLDEQFREISVQQRAAIHEQLDITDEQLDKLLSVDVRDVVRVNPAARGAADSIEIEVHNNDVLELEFEDGVRQWILAEDFREDLESIGDPSGDKLLVEAVTRRRSGSRGLVDLGLKFLKRLGFDPIEAGAEQAAQKIAQRFESRLKPGPGLYKCEDATELGEKIENDDQIKTKDPILIFIHGTFSSTRGSFAVLSQPPSTGDDAETEAEELEPTQEWRELQEHYSGRVYAFEHRTLTESPIQNACYLAELLPPEQRVHLVSHSRGGLVGELLCLGDIQTHNMNFAELVDQLYRRDAPEEVDAQHRAQLIKLEKVLRKREVQVERFVRVACPARGTILASKRIDRFASVLLNTIGWIPGLRSSVLYNLVKSTLLELIAARTKPEYLPGLSAQMPDSPLVRLLNSPAIETQADLAVIAGDFEGSGLFKRLLDFAADFYYRTENDLVVDTDAMYAGIPRSETTGVYGFCDRGDEVNHFKYFSNLETRRLMHQWLIADEAKEKEEEELKEKSERAGFYRIDPSSQRIVKEPISRGVSEDRPIVFVLPGIMGSELRQEGSEDPIWLSLTKIAFGGMADLKVDATGIEPAGLLQRHYGDFVDFLQTSHEVRLFPFDWRLSIGEAAETLAESIQQAIDDTLEQQDENPARPLRPIRIVAHSLGGLVVRSMIKRHGEIWDTLCQREGCRFVMLGTPNRGSYAIPRMLMGRDRLVNMIALLDLRHRRSELLDFIRKFPGVLELLPEASDAFDLFTAAGWQDLGSSEQGWTPPSAADLRTARKARNDLEEQVPHSDRVAYVAGVADVTPSAIKVRDGNVAFLGTAAGDGRVTYDSGILPNVETWYMRAEHGELTTHRPGFDGILELLQRGETTLLSKEPPLTRGVSDSFELPKDDSAMMPTEEELSRVALGCSFGASRRSDEIDRQVLGLSVCHGDLTHVKHPVLVGHHEDDSIVSAESTLDQLFDGELSRRLNMGIYPGARGTTDVIRNSQPEADQPNAALVVGLGKVGELSREGLRKGVASAAKRYVLGLADNLESDRGQSDLPVIINALLVGSGQRSPLTVAESMSAIVDGVCDANHDLGSLERPREQTHVCGQFRVDEVRFIELFEDTAITATHALRDIDGLLVTRHRCPLRIHDRMIKLRGGRRRTDNSAEVEGWWQRVKVNVNDKTKDLQYHALTTRARTEQSLQSTQRKLIDRLICESIHRPDATEVTNTLFELLIPNEMKDAIPDISDLLLLVDSTAANYPWELLCDHLGGGEQPLAVRMGLLRQLDTTRFRRRPVTASHDDALVIGDPDLTGADADWSPCKTELEPWLAESLKHVKQLPGALQEAKLVDRFLRKADYTVRSDIAEQPVRVVTDLFSQPYKVVHIAAHGLYNVEQPKYSGVVLGQGLFLTATEISQLRIAPEFVFLNCCHLAKIDERKRGDTSPNPSNGYQNRLAASISEELMAIGVKAVVAAGWAVNDAAAETFACRFYEEMLSGAPFGRAVRNARITTFEEFPNTNTWGAYQCYGDPEYRFDSTSKSGGNVPRIPVSKREFIDEFFNVEQRASSAKSNKEDPILIQRLKRLDDWLPEELRNDSDVLAEIGQAYAELDQSDKAVAAYRKALEQEESTVSLRIVEQLANVEARAAHAKLREHLHEEPRAREEARLRKAAADQIKKAMRPLESLLKIHVTSERKSLLASAYKRLAQVQSTKGQRTKALAKSAELYQQAAELSPDAYYPTLNWLTLSMLSGKAKDLDEQIEGCANAARREHRRNPSFWTEVTATDAALVKSLATAQLQTDQGHLLDSYKRLQKRTSSRKFKSVLEQLQFLCDWLRDPELCKTANITLQDVKALDQIAKSLGD
jgi:tetratricopeptide (TPR) repeat protein